MKLSEKLHNRLLQKVKKFHGYKIFLKRVIKNLLGGGKFAPATKIGLKFPENAHLFDQDLMSFTYRSSIQRKACNTPLPKFH